MSGLAPALGIPPTFGMEADGEHFWWSHDCIFHHYGRGADRPYRTREQTLPLGSDGWQLIMAEPLMVAPSILCSGCNTHGFIREGKWVSA